VNTIPDFVSVNAIRINEENFKTSTLYVLIKLFFINKKTTCCTYIFYIKNNHRFSPEKLVVLLIFVFCRVLSNGRVLFAYSFLPTGLLLLQFSFQYISCCYG